MAAFIAVSFASCGNKTANAVSNDSDTVAVDSVILDTVGIDSFLCPD